MSWNEILDRPFEKRENYFIAIKYLKMSLTDSNKLIQKKRKRIAKLNEEIMRLKKHCYSVKTGLALIDKKIKRLKK